MARVAAFASGFVLASASWDDYKNQFGKVYNGDEEEAHRVTYEANMQMIAEQNSKGEDLTFGENQFTDLTQEQYRISAGLGYIEPTEMATPNLGEHTYDGEELASSVDWTSRGAVTAVKDQGQCGSCWAFSTTGSIEGAWQIGSGRLKSISEQQLVDCDTHSNGCSGGNMGSAMAWEGGVHVCTENSYPYTGRAGHCKSSCQTAIPRGGVSGHKTVQKSTNALKSAIQHGPVSVAIQADQSSFQHYKSGTLSSGCGTSLDHGVLAVGYTSSYFKVKNSWGSNWGKHGYIQISTSGNVCGIHNQAVYPVVSASVAV